MAEARHRSLYSEPLSDPQKSALFESYQAVRGLFGGVLNGWTITRWAGTSRGDGLKVGAFMALWCIIPEWRLD